MLKSPGTVGVKMLRWVSREWNGIIFIEPGVPHEVLNLSDTEPVVAVVSRSSAAEWDDIVDYPSRRRPASEQK